MAHIFHVNSANPFTFYLANPPSLPKGMDVVQHVMCQPISSWKTNNWIEKSHKIHLQLNSTLFQYCNPHTNNKYSIVLKNRAKFNHHLLSMFLSVYFFFSFLYPLLSFFFWTLNRKPKHKQGGNPPTHPDPTLLEWWQPSPQ